MIKPEIMMRQFPNYYGVIAEFDDDCLMATISLTTRNLLTNLRKQSPKLPQKMAVKLQSVFMTMLSRQFTPLRIWTDRKQFQPLLKRGKLRKNTANF